MDNPSPQKKKRYLVGVMGGVAVLVAVMSYFGGRELCYFVAAKTTDAKVIGQTPESRSARGGGLQHSVVVDYSFTEPGGRHRNERDELPFDSSHAIGQTVKVEYIPGVAGMSRLQIGRHRTVSLMMLGWAGVMLVLLLGVGLLNAKYAQRVKALPEKPIANGDETKSFKMFNAKSVGWSVAVVVATLVLGVRVFGEFDEGGFITVFMVALVSALVIYSNVIDVAARKRTFALRHVARRMRFQFVPQGHDDLHQSLEGFHLATLGMHQRLFNLMHGKIEGTDVAVFDYEYAQGKQLSHQTVIWLQRRGTKRTNFVLRPEVHWIARLGSFFVEYQDINFESHPTFSREYLLRGTDESEIRELFTDNVLNFYEQNLGLSTEGSGNKLLYYYAGGRFEPEEIRSFLKEAIQLLSLLEPSTSS